MVVFFVINKNDNRWIKNDVNQYKDDVRGDDNRWETSSVQVRKL